jgi:hypothetical protein
MQRVLRNAYKQKDAVAVYAQSKTSRKINVEDYGYDSKTIVVDQESFKVTKEFEDFNPRVVGTTRIGEWETVESVPTEPDLNTDLELNPVIVEQNLTREKVEFELTEKKVQLDQDETSLNKDVELVFKKKEKKQFRKK